MTAPPVLLLPGFAETGSHFARLAERLRPQREVELVRFRGVPFRSLDHLARQLAARIAEHARRSPRGQVDLVGFSMGSVVARTYVQRALARGERPPVRRLVALAGPHAGTWLAYLLPFRTVVDMRPGSAHLRSLDASLARTGWGDVEVFSARSTVDYMIVPATSATVPGALHERLWFYPAHRWFPAYEPVVRHVVQLLDAPPPCGNTAS